MKPFMELPIVINNSDGVEKDVVARIQPEEIDYYYPGIHTGTVIVTKSRSSFITRLPVEQLDAAMAAYHKLRKGQPDKFGNLSITKTA